MLQSRQKVNIILGKKIFIVNRYCESKVNSNLSKSIKLHDNWIRHKNWVLD